MHELNKGVLDHAMIIKGFDKNANLNELILGDKLTNVKIKDAIRTGCDIV